MPDYDENLLRIHARVRLADGRSWSFDDPSPLTWEAQELLQWLRDAAAGRVPVAPITSDGIGDDFTYGTAGVLGFIEPVLAFSVATRTAREVTVRVHLSLEALPPWVPANARPRVYSHYVEVASTPDALMVAADQWERQLAAFPARGR